MFGVSCGYSVPNLLKLWVCVKIIERANIVLIVPFLVSKIVFSPVDLLSDTKITFI